MILNEHAETVARICQEHRLLVDVARAAKAMVEDGFPHGMDTNTAGDEWFEIMCRRLRPVEHILEREDEA